MGPPWGFLVAHTLGAPVEARLLELDFARAIETWNDATASSLATTYAPRLVHS